MKKRLIVLLGAHGHLGCALVSHLAQLQEPVFGMDQQVESDNHELIGYAPCDLRFQADIDGSLQKIPYSEYENITIITAVGVFSEASFSNNEFNEKDFINSLQVNLVGVSLFISKMIARGLKEGKTIRAVIVGSTAAHVGSQDIGYGVAKAGLNGLVRSISKSLSNKGVVIIGVDPGIFESPMSSRVTMERQQKAMNDTHIKRKGTVDEIVNVVSYLALSAPDYLTGSIIPLNGGQHA